MKALFFSISIGLALSGSLHAICCKFYEERIEQRQELRPEYDILQEPVWPWGQICHPRVEIKGVFINDRQTDIITRDRTTGDELEAVMAIGAAPIGNAWILYLHGEWGSEIQQNRVTRQDNYNVQIERAGIGVRRQLSRCWIGYVEVVAKHAAPRSATVFPFQSTTRFEPAVLLRSCTTERELTFALFRDSFVVRDTVGGGSFLYSRDDFLARLEKFYCYPHRALGAEGQVIHYEDGPANAEQRISLWYRTGFPGVENNILFRYQFDYRRFNHTVSEYLSFNHRVAHGGTFSWLYPLFPCSCVRIDVNFTWMRTRNLNDPGQQTRSNGIIVPGFIFKQTLTSCRVEGWYEQELLRWLCLRLGGGYFWDGTRYYAIRGTVALQGRF